MKILRWIIGIFIILLGILFITDSFLSSLMLLISGLLMLPVTTKKIKNFNGRKPILISLIIILFFTGMSGIGNDVNNVETTNASKVDKNNIENNEKDNNLKDDNKKDDNKKETSDKKDDNKKDDNKKETSDKKDDDKKDDDKNNKDKKTNSISEEEIKSIISKNINKTISEKKAKKLSDKMSEESFFNVWRKELYNNLNSSKNWGNDSKEISNKYLKLYISLFGENNNLINIKKHIDDLNKLEEKNYQIYKKYPFKIENANVFSDNFYVRKKLETRYKDNISGQIQKEIDSYNTKSYIDWLCSDVEYNSVFGNSPGEQTFILRSKDEYIFNKSGSYFVSYIDINETMDLIDNNGFKSKAPIFLIFTGDSSKLQQDKSTLEKNKLLLEQLYNDYLHLLKEGTVAEQKKISNNLNNNGINNKDTKLYEFLNSIDYILPSNERYISENELFYLTNEYGPKILRYAVNEIYARHGYIFKKDQYKEYFSNKSWYYPIEGLEDPYIKDVLFNEYEKANLKFFLEFESNNF